ncbi:MFS general substrate transporter [Xylariaceae sp. AK1471]|nr:MFS general substrate transporter [Xylariaceae sp. AK1471]
MSRCTVSTTSDMEKASSTTESTVELLVGSSLDNRPRTAIVSEEAEIQEPSGVVAVYDYLKVVGLFSVYFISVGQLAAFSTYQDYYEEDLLATYSPSSISWIGTTQVFLLGIVGLLSGALHDRGHIREVLIPGFALVVIGLLLLSFSHEFWHVILAQGFCIGIGSALFYIPAISIVSNSFGTRRTLAVGVAASGAALGGIIWPIAFRGLLPSVGFGWVNRAFALLVLIFSVVSYYSLTSGYCVVKPGNQRPRRARILYVFSRRGKSETETSSRGTYFFTREQFNKLLAACSGQAYQFLCIGVFFVLLGYWVPLFYLVPYASLSLGTSPTHASYLLSILNAASLFGRVVPAILGHQLGAANILLTGATTLGVVVFAWISIGNIVGVTVWCVFLGFTAGSVITIPNAVASRLSQSHNTGTRIGIMWAVGAFAELIGPPVAGALLTQHDGKTNYLGCQIFSGVSISIGAVFLIFPAWFIFNDDRTRAFKVSLERSG